MILVHSFPVAIADNLVTINQDMKALHCEGKLFNRFLVRCLSGFASVLIRFAETSAHGTKKLETGTLKKFVLPVPAIHEQHEIVEWLERQLTNLEHLRSITSQTIDRLTEYRTALITAATTGKIDVRDVRIPGFDEHATVEGYTVSTIPWPVRFAELDQSQSAPFFALKTFQVRLWR